MNTSAVLWSLRELPQPQRFEETRRFAERYRRTLVIFDAQKRTRLSKLMDELVKAEQPR